MSDSTLPKRILTLGMSSDYPPEFAEISAACEFAIAVAPDGQIAVVKDRQGSVPRAPTVEELLSVQPVTPGNVAGILGGGNATNGQRPAPRFDFGDRVTPGPDSTLDALRDEVGRVTHRRWCENCHGWHYIVRFGRSEAQMMEPNMWPADAERGEESHADSPGAPGAIEAPAPDGWQGTRPAEGTRRATILNVIQTLPDATPLTPLDIADRIESALLEETIEEEAEELLDGAGEEPEDTHGFSGAFDVLVGPDGAHVSIDSLVRVLSQLGDEAEEEYDDQEPMPRPFDRFLDFLGIGR